MRFFNDFLTGKEGSVKKDLSLLTLFLGIAFFQFLGRIPLMEPDEGRYAEIPREMLESGDFITPFLNYVKYFEKPPLHYWLNALSFSVFGQNEFAARFPGALMGLLTCLLAYFAGRKLFCRRSGLLAALILGTSTGFLLQARIDITDLTLTCALSASLFFFILAAGEGEQRKGLYYHLFYACAALAVLAKGLIGIVFPCAIIFIQLVVTRNWRLVREMRLATGIPLFLLVAAPWFVAVSLQNPEFPRFFFIHEHFERFLTKVHGRYKPFWYFVPVLAGTMFPWALFIPSALKGVWRERLSRDGRSRLFLAIWIIVIFIFFSKSDSKLIPYILPIFPPLALLMGRAFSRSFPVIAGAVKIEGYILAALLTLFGTGCIAYPFIAPSPEFSLIACIVIGGILFGEGIITFVSVRQRSLPHLVAGIVLCSYAVGIVSPALVLAQKAEKRSVRELGIIVREKAKKEDVVASWGLVQGLSFFAGRRVVIVGFRGEVDFGSNQGDNSGWFYDLPAFVRVWDSPARVYFLLMDEQYNQLRESSVRPVPKMVARSGDFVLVTNR